MSSCRQCRVAACRSSPPAYFLLAGSGWRGQAETEVVTTMIITCGVGVAAVPVHPRLRTSGMRPKTLPGSPARTDADRAVGGRRTGRRVSVERRWKSQRPPRGRVRGTCSTNGMPAVRSATRITGPAVTPWPPDEGTPSAGAAESAWPAHCEWCRGVACRSLDGDGGCRGRGVRLARRVLRGARPRRCPDAWVWYATPSSAWWRNLRVERRSACVRGRAAAKQMRRWEG